MAQGLYYQAQRPLPPSRTQNFFWYTERDDILGEGSYGVVFRGISVQAKRLVAIKVAHPNNPPSTHLLERREIDILQKMDHENIVKLFAVETELGSNRNAIIMELCVGGTLLDFISLPENAYGTEEEEFKLVLKNVTNGRKYLFDHNIVHRDLKPGNIMRCLTEEGATLYKLADFGNAKQLNDNNEAYMSICGTEEYLHPAVYGKALIDKGKQVVFTADTDLWAIGATMYHTGTGKVPFRAFGNRTDRATTFNIISRKLPGFISGVQEIQNGQIIYSRNLPETACLSNSLKSLIEPMLAGVLETDSSKAWSFEKYFNHVHVVLHMACVFVFNVQRLEVVKLYVSMENFEELRKLIAEQIKVAPENQVLLFEDDVLKTFPKTSTKDNPVFLFNGKSVMVDAQDRNKAPAFPFFQNGIVRDDKKVSEAKCRSGYVYSRMVCTRRDAAVLGEKASRMLHNCVQFKMKIRLKESLRLYSAQLESHKKRWRILTEQNRKIRGVLMNVDRDLQKDIRLNDTSRTDTLERIEKQIENIRVQLCDLTSYLKQVKNCQLPKDSNTSEECQRIANQTEVLTQDLRKAQDYIENFWKYPKPTGDKTSYYYDLKKNKASQACGTIVELLTKQQSILNQYAIVVTQETLKKTLKLFLEGCSWQNIKLQAFPEKMAQVTNQLDAIEQEGFACVFKIINALNAVIQQHDNSASNAKMNGKRTDAYTSILSSISEVNQVQRTEIQDVVDEYSDLVRQLQNIMVPTNPDETAV